MVFGGTSGINLGIAHAFAERGANLSVASRNPENINAARGELESTGSKVLALTADVRDFDAVGKALAGMTDHFGPVDVLVSGAAGNFLCEANKMSANGFKVVLDIDLVGSFNVFRQAWAHLRRPGASVISITAPQSWIPMRYQAHCGAAKAGIDQLTRVLALEWGEEGVRINSISPGPIEGTEGFRRLMAADEEQRRRSLESVPLGRLGLLEDIANLALFLGSSYASFISGVVIPCDGGGAFESVKPALEATGLAMRRESSE